jgi:hypothetical protein
MPETKQKGTFDDEELSSAKKSCQNICLTASLI